MNPSGPLRAGLSRYRRHKLSLDGRTPGIEYPRSQGGTPRPRARAVAPRGIKFSISPSRPFGPPAENENGGEPGASVVD